MILGLDAPTIFAFLGAGVVLNLTPGADVMFASASGASGGPRVGIAAAFGVSLGALLHTVLAALGLSALLIAFPWAFEVVKWAGAGYLVYLAWRSWTAPPATLGRGTSSLRRAVLRGFITNAVNPKVALFILAFLPQFTRPDTGPAALQMLALGTGFALTGFLITAAYGIAAGFAGERIARGRVMNRISAVVFAALALRLLFGEAPGKA